MTAGSRRNGSSKFGPRNRGFVGHHAPFGQKPGSDSDSNIATAQQDFGAVAGGDDYYGYYADDAYYQAAPSTAGSNMAGSRMAGSRPAGSQTAGSQTAGTASYPAYAGDHAHANQAGTAERAAASSRTHWWYVDAAAEQDYAEQDYAAYDDRDPYDYARRGERAPYEDRGPYDDRASYGDYATYGDDAQRLGHDFDDSVVAGNPAGTAMNAGDGDGGNRKVAPGRRGEHYSGRHASRQGKAARKRVSKVVPAAAVAATLAAGAAVYSLTGASHPQAAQQSQSMGPVSLGDAATVGAGHANGAASTMIKAARAAGNGAARAAAAGKAARKASAAPKATAAASPTASAVASPAQALGSPVAIENNTENNADSNGTVAAPASPATAAAAPSAVPSSAASPSVSASSSAPAASTLSCGQSGLLPANVTAIVSFLLSNGYSDNAAAGIAGNIYQESKGNPESEGMGGGGLIGWTPLPAGFVTGNPTADLQTQLAALLTYNQGWSGYLPALNSAASPADAAYIYVTDFERAGIPAAATREQAAEDVASACGI